MNWVRPDEVGDAGAELSACVFLQEMASALSYQPNGVARRLRRRESPLWAIMAASIRRALPLVHIATVPGVDH